MGSLLEAEKQRFLAGKPTDEPAMADETETSEGAGVFVCPESPESQHIQSEMATRQSSKTCPVPRKQVRLPFAREFTPEVFERVRMGFTPGGTDDRWFAFLEDDWLYLHRSWTGFCVYWLRVAETPTGYFVQEAWANRNSKQYGCSSEDEDVETLGELLRMLFDA